MAVVDATATEPLMTVVEDTGNKKGERQFLNHHGVGVVYSHSRPLETALPVGPYDVTNRDVEQRDPALSASRSELFT